MPTGEAPIGVLVSSLKGDSGTAPVQLLHCNVLSVDLPFDFPYTVLIN